MCVCVRVCCRGFSLCQEFKRCKNVVLLYISTDKYMYIYPHKNFWVSFSHYALNTLWAQHIVSIWRTLSASIFKMPSLMTKLQSSHKTQLKHTDKQAVKAMSEELRTRRSRSRLAYSVDLLLNWFQQEVWIFIDFSVLTPTFTVGFLMKSNRNALYQA